MDMMTMWVAIGAIGIVCIGIGSLMTGIVAIISLVQNRKFMKGIGCKLDKIADRMNNK